MCKLLCVTNRHLCRGDFLTRVEEIAFHHPNGIILREKDLPLQEYEALAKQVQNICHRYEVPCILHSFGEVARSLSADGIQLPLSAFLKLSPKEKATLPPIGVSCHSVQDAAAAYEQGASCIVAGHIFDTACKKGLSGRGLSFLEEVCNAVPIPVYGIGGVTPENISQIVGAGAAGGCVMSTLMECEDVAAFFSKWKGASE